MGTYYTYGATRKSTIADLTPKPQDREDGGYFKTLKHCCCGNVLWAVHESKAKRDGVFETVRFIGCYLMMPGRNGWGYKPMDEYMHPFYYSCPMSYLGLAPLDTSSPCADNSKEWREGVQDYWMQRRQ